MTRVTEQAFELGTVDAEFGWSGGILIEPGLVAFRAIAYLRSVQKIGSSPRIGIASTADGDDTDAGPELSNAWETHADAITLHRDGVDDLVLKGPNNPDNSFSDPTEPYFWVPDNGTEFAAWWDSNIDFTSFRITFRTPPITIRTGEAEAGQVATAGIEGTGRKLDAATRTGTGEPGEPAAAGVEGTGRKIDAATRTGSGEAGEVTAAGVEGVGDIVRPKHTGTGEAGEVAAAGVEGTGRKLDAATRTGAGEAGQAAAAGVEGVGRPKAVAIPGAGEAGAVATAGLEGSGQSAVVPATGTGEAGEVAAAGVEGAGRIHVTVLTGSGEVGTVTTAGVEGTAATRAVVRTGEGEAGEVTAAGIEGLGIDPSGPVFRVVLDLLIYRGRDVSIQLPRASNDDNQGNVIYTVTGLPAGLSFDADALLITGETMVAKGDYTIVYTATAAP